MSYSYIMSNSQLFCTTTDLPEQVAPCWHYLQTSEAALLMALYEAAETLALDSEWLNDDEPWCLGICCSPSKWRELIHSIEQQDSRSGGR